MQIADEIKWFLKAALHGERPEILSYPVVLDFAFYFKGRVLDASNCGFMAKIIEDGLVLFKILENDDYKHVSSVSYSAKKGNENMIVLKILDH